MREGVMEKGSDEERREEWREERRGDVSKLRHVYCMLPEAQEQPH